MSMRSTALAWLAKNFPAEPKGQIRSSKYYEQDNVWFLTLPTSFLIDPTPGNLLVLLQHEGLPQEFHLLRIPFEFLRENKSKFDVRTGGELFDISISANKLRWMTDLRRKEINFSEFCA